MSKPYPYQLEGLDHIDYFDGRALLALEMGLGKTPISLWWAKRNKTWPTVIVSPASLKWNWRSEIAKYLRMNCTILNGTKPEKQNVIPSSIYIVNYDILGAWISFFEKIKPKLVVLDECHYLASTSSNRTKASRKLCALSPHILALSGTPLSNCPANLWPVLNILDPKLFPSFHAYAVEFCAPKKTFYGWDYRGAANLPKLNRILTRNLMVRMTKDQVLTQLPAKTRSVVPIQPDVAIFKEYKAAEKDFIAWLIKSRRSKNINKTRNAERLVKMGYLKRLIGLAKLKGVKAWIEEYLNGCDGKLIVFGVHKNVVETLHSHFDNSVLVNGTINGAQRQKAFEQFANHPDTRLFVGNIKAAGVGWNGTVANAVAFSEMGWTPGEHVQCEDRVHRIGQVHPSSCYYLIIPGTIEDKLCRILQAKQSVLSAVLDGGKVDNDLDIYNKLEESLIHDQK